ncbi:hypothetical protein AAG906_001067 [Vitis piasezkii]
MPLSRVFQRLVEGGFIAPLLPRPPLQPTPLGFRTDLHYAYHQKAGHDIDSCSTLRHAIQDLIDQDALVRALGRLELISLPPGGLIHFLTDRVTCIVFSDDDLPPEGLGHIRSLYISVALDNGSALNVCPLATTIALGFSPSDLGLSTQTVRAYDGTRRTVMGTITAQVMIGPVRYSVLFQVLRIQSSFNLLLGRPWVHKASAIPSSLHQKVKFIHEGRIIMIQSDRDVITSFELVLHIIHSEDDLHLIGFTFDEVQVVSLEDDNRDMVPMSFDQDKSTLVLNMMRGMSHLPAWDWVATVMDHVSLLSQLDHDIPYGLGYTPMEE